MKKNVALIVLLLYVTLFSAPWNRPAMRPGTSGGNAFSQGAAGGVVVYLKPDLSKLNNYVKDFGIGEIDENFYLWGGELYGHIDNRFTLGTQYITGSNSSEGRVTLPVDTLGNEVTLTRNVRYTISYGGLSFMYKKNYSGFEIFGGVGANIGSVTLVMSQDSGDQDFGSLWGSFDPGMSQEEWLSTLNRSTRYKATAYVGELFSGVRYYITKEVALQLSAGYTYCHVSDDGEINYEFESVSGAPDLGFKSMRFSLGIFLGN